VGPVSPVSNGSKASAVGPMAGARTGAVAVTGAGATGLKGSTVTWMTDSVGLKNMVTVAAACLSNGRDIRKGDNKESEALDGNTGEMKGPMGLNGGNNEGIGMKGQVRGIDLKKGFTCPNQNGNWANAASFIHNRRAMIQRIRIYLFMVGSPLN